ncbi:hypothetical protein [Streptomyces sp. NPDC046939]|uniref:hypothetical protein n=1 Tax=Streptomyces sp. NPDC046939 TaxID=3155376 RepID=UPI0033F64039
MRPARHPAASHDEQTDNADNAQDAEDAVRQAYRRAQATRQHSARLRQQAKNLVAQSRAQRLMVQAVRAGVRRGGPQTPHGA